MAFVTHGVMAGEIGKDMEPGLMLTPPRFGAVDDDGYLTASEIAKLKLNADWVLLSAGNAANAWSFIAAGKLALRHFSCRFLQISGKRRANKGVSNLPEVHMKKS
ncbi:MAG: CHAT domain-containing protein [Burkholderiales bacterium]|nr:CHAT domain-containing protein [Burkholderiales bacterium]